MFSYPSPSVHSVHTSSVWKNVFKLHLKNSFLTLFICPPLFGNCPKTSPLYGLGIFLSSPNFLYPSQIYTIIFLGKICLSELKKILSSFVLNWLIQLQGIITSTPSICSARLNKANWFTIIFCEELFIPQQPIKSLSVPEEILEQEWLKPDTLSTGILTSLVQKSTITSLFLLDVWQVCWYILGYHLTFPSSIHVFSKPFVSQNCTLNLRGVCSCTTFLIPFNSKKRQPASEKVQIYI